ncbi:MAG TPA: hypothetical protein VK927_04285 [Adhaeribacter sp.]|nr:hypothetical protein [Adhaeribacter sp.]
MEITDEDVILVDKALQMLLQDKPVEQKMGCFRIGQGQLTLNYADENGPCLEYHQYNKLLEFMKDQELLLKKDGRWGLTKKGLYIGQHGGFQQFFYDEVERMEKETEREKIKQRFSRLLELLSSKKYWWFWLLLLLLALFLLFPALLALLIDNN